MTDARVKTERTGMNGRCELTGVAVLDAGAKITVKLRENSLVEVTVLGAEKNNLFKFK